jgi:hypothetical protein
MQGCELLAPVVVDVRVLAAEVPAPRETREQEPALRYEVESLQHWIDLNA